MNGQRKNGLPHLIAHYNYLRSCGLSRGAYGSALRTRKDAALDPARTFSPMQPDQRVTLSLETPLSGTRSRK